MEEIVFPNQLRMMRRVRGRRMIELADLLGLTISALSKIEKGYRRLNEDQIKKVATFLDCPCEALLVSETASQPEVLEAWKNEQHNRRQKNLGGGLRVLGAGLRYIRGQKKMSLMALAKGAKLTLSVYHRIEMGQREVDEKTFENIAHALGMSETDLQVKIYELDTSGALDELKNNTGKRGIGLFKGGYNDLPMSRLVIRSGTSQEKTISISGMLTLTGEVLLNQESAVGAVLCPSTLSDDPNIYAVRMGEASSLTMLPPESILLVSPTMPIRLSDWVIFKQNEQKYLGRVVESTDDSIEVIDFQKNQKYQIVKTDCERIVLITLI